MAAGRDDPRRDLRNPARWARVKEVFLAARECEPGRRAAFLEAHCGGDDSLRNSVEAMLARESDADAFLESPALEVEARAMASGPVLAAESSESGELANPPVGRRDRSTPPRWWVGLLAAVFLADFALRTWCFLFGPATLGISTRAEGGRAVVTTLVPGDVAERSGLRAGDTIVACDGQPVETPLDPWAQQANLAVGRTYVFEIERDGRRIHVPMTVDRFRVLRHSEREARVLWQMAAAVLLATGILVAFKRSRDPVACMGALTLATLSVSMCRFHSPPGYAAYWRSVPAGLGNLLWIPNLCLALVGPMGLGFFARFPRSLFRTRWIWGLVWLPALFLLPFEMRTVFMAVFRPAVVSAVPVPPWVEPSGIALYGACGLAMLAAITANYFRLTDPAERRRLQLLIVGGAAGTLPALLRFMVLALAPQSRLRGFLMSRGPDALIATGFLLFPMSFAYAVPKHRLLDIRVIVRMGVQYALARGMVLSLVPVLAVLLVSDALVHGDQPPQEILAVRGWIYALIGALAVAAHTQRHRWSAAIDRRFFRDQYDASHLLREVADQARRARSLERAAPGVVARIEAALHPEFAALLFRSADEARFRSIASAPLGRVPPPIDANGTLAARLRTSEEPLELSGREAERAGKWTSGLEPDELRRARVELLIPVAMGSGRHEAILALGPKRSEEPYTHDDLEALEAIASSLALLAEGTTPQPDRVTGTFAECPVCGGCHDTGTARCPHGHAALVAVAMPRTLGGRYRLERRLGRGGMGTVYEAVDVALDRRVAVKVVRDEWAHNSLATQRFRREARAVAGFAHPNVVTVYDYGVEVGSRVFLVIELLSGRTLREELRRDGRLDAPQAVSVLRSVCSAVDAAHRRGFVHRDLKPENICLADAAGPVKVLDFGVVKPLMHDQTAEPGEPPETEVGVLVGTVGYMSPEQRLGDSPSISWDIWALTIVASESLTAALPFPIESRESWRQLVLAGRHRPLADHVANPPAAWQTLFDRALATDPAARPASAAEFFRQLEQALA